MTRVACLLLASAMILAGCTQTAPEQVAPEATPAELPGGAVESDRITLAMIEPDDGVGPLTEFIDGARKSLDIAMYELDPSYRPVRRALRGAVERGATVRVLLSRRYYPPGSPNPNPGAVRALRRIGVAAELSGPTYSYAHWKVLVRDSGTRRQQALVCDFNVARSYFAYDPAYPKEGGTRGMAALVSDRRDIAEIAANFEAAWPPYADQLPAKRPNLVWAPAAQRYDPRGNAIAALGDLIRSARSTIDLYIQQLPVPARLLDPLVERARAGVSVRIIGNRGGMDDAVGPLTRAGAQVRYGPPAANGKPLYIHTKSILVDVSTPGGVVFIGSENPFVNMSLNSERELGVLLTDPSSRERLRSLFDRDFAGATPS